LQASVRVRPQASIFFAKPKHAVRAHVLMVGPHICFRQEYAINIDPEIAQTRPAVLIASVVHLLTCSALHGVSIAKSRSLSQHLAALAAGPDVDPLLRRACNELMQIWYQQAVELSHEQIFDDAGQQALVAAVH
jgi:hypothetical protein